jgi:hypothetical protein
MAADARGMGAEGIVGSDVHLRVHEVRAYRANPYNNNESESIEDHVVEFTALGTAIAAIGRGYEPPEAALTLTLNDK